MNYNVLELSIVVILYIIFGTSETLFISMHCVFFLDYPGVRLDNSGRIIPHSILGSVEDFIEQAVKVGDQVVSKATFAPLARILFCG